MRISDWSSDVCSSDLRPIGVLRMKDGPDTDDKVIAVPVSKVDKSYEPVKSVADLPPGDRDRLLAFFRIYKQDASGKTPILLSGFGDADERSEEHTSELQSLMRISYAVFCLKKKNT